jgi:hypothetical protein
LLAVVALVALLGQVVVVVQEAVKVDVVQVAVQEGLLVWLVQVVH